MNVLHVNYYSEVVTEKHEAQLSDPSCYKVTDALLIFYKATAINKMSS